MPNEAEIEEKVRYKKYIAGISEKTHVLLPSGVPSKNEKRRALLRRIGTALIKARTAQNLTQADLAHAAGCGAAMISHIESMSKMPSVELLESLSVVLGVTVDYFLSENGQRKNFTSIQFSLPGHLSQADQERLDQLVRSLDYASRSDKELIFSIAERILKMGATVATVMGTTM